jgi:hypothetical protein
MRCVKRRDPLQERSRKSILTPKWSYPKNLALVYSVYESRSSKQRYNHYTIGQNIILFHIFSIIWMLRALLWLKIITRICSNWYIYHQIGITVFFGSLYFLRNSRPMVARHHECVKTSDHCKTIILCKVILQNFAGIGIFSIRIESFQVTVQCYLRIGQTVFCSYLFNQFECWRHCFWQKSSEIFSPLIYIIRLASRTFWFLHVTE